MPIIDILNNLPGSEDEQIAGLKKRHQITDIKSLKGAVLFGTGYMGIKFARKFKELDVPLAYFADNNHAQWDRTIESLTVLPPSEIPGKDRPIIIASKYVMDIYSQLHKLGYTNIIPHFALSAIFQQHFPNELYKGAINSIIKSKKNIIRVHDSLYDAPSKTLFEQMIKFRITLSPEDLPMPELEQYYPGKFWELSDNETYMDVGAFDGDTLLQFIKHSGGKFKKYYALEPDHTNFIMLKNAIPQEYKDKVIALEVGAGARSKEVAFSGLGRDDSYVSDRGDIRIKIVSLDELCSNEDVTTIKIDVEGYEPEVLKGCEKIIKGKKPKLAVCVYHRPAHLWELPFQIASINPGYKFYLRHHEPELYGTVLYAV
jgi:FkbM family methyltransferase